MCVCVCVCVCVVLKATLKTYQRGIATLILNIASLVELDITSMYELVIKLELVCENTYTVAKFLCMSQLLVTDFCNRPYDNQKHVTYNLKITQFTCLT